MDQYSSLGGPSPDFTSTEWTSRPKEQTFNILLLGETGVGKSTFINAFYNYMSFNTLEDAEESPDIHYQIPAKFTMTDADFRQHVVEVGGNDNEVHETGASVTRGARSYVFSGSSENVNIRIIDTPGVGDTRGPDQDKFNFETTMEYIAEYDELHAICILLKPNDCRITIMFEYCIKELLCRLENSASQNMVFIFTNAKGTSYRPGETLPSLQKLLESTKSQPPYAEIPLNRHNVFCFDNEAFRYLLAAKQDGVEITYEEKENYRKSWEHSSRECQRLIEYMRSLEPHAVKNTISVNEARKNITQLRQPLIEIDDLIHQNIMALNEKKMDIQACNDDVQNLKKEMYIPYSDLIVSSLEQPKTVCTNPGCNKINVSSHGTAHYENSCCNPCYLTHTVLSSFDDHKLMFCEAMLTNSSNKFSTLYNCVKNLTWSYLGGDDDIKCKVCGCHYSLHKHIYYESNAIQGKLIDEEVSEKIVSKQNAKTAAKAFINQVEERIAEYEGERIAIRRATAEFAHFLKTNVLLSFNDAYEQYIKHAIDREKSLYGLDKSKSKVDYYTRVLEEYRNEKKFLEEEFQRNSNAVITAGDVMRTIRDLYKLKHFGNKIKEMFIYQIRARRSEYTKQSEIRVTINKASLLCQNVYKSLQTNFSYIRLYVSLVLLGIILDSFRNFILLDFLYMLFQMTKIVFNIMKSIEKLKFLETEICESKSKFK